MGFLDKLFGKKEVLIQSNSDFWNWFLENEKDFFKIVQEGNNIRKGFLNKISPKLEELHDGFFYLTGMFDEQTAELILTPDGNIRNIYVIEDFINAAPVIEGWRFTALKQASDIKDLVFKYENFEFNSENIKFYPNIDKNFPDEIDLTIGYDHFVEDKKESITNGVYLFLDNYLGELHSVTLIDNLKVVGTNEISEELIPIGKLKDYLIWREKEFVEKYEGIRHDTENDSFAGFEANSEDNGVLIAIINTDVLKWDKKASHPWILSVEVLFDGTKNNGMPDDKTYKMLGEIEDELMVDLKDCDGYLNIGRETTKNKRKIYFACKEFRKPPKVLDATIKKYNGTLEINYEIYKDKYWQSFSHYEQN